MRDLLIEIMNTGIPASATLGLSASWAEMTDALQVARINDGQTEYSVELLNSKHDYLVRLIPANADIFELNFLSERLSSLEEWQTHCFEGMCLMEAQRTKNEPIPLERLINLTFSTVDCQVVYEARDDEALGRFYAENDFITELSGLPDKVWNWLDFNKIGEYMRVGEGGVFTHHGYVVQNGEFSTEYTSDKCPRPPKPDHVFKMDVAHYLYEEKEAYAPVVTLRLPAAPDELMSALERIEAPSWEETVCTGFEGMIPGFEETFAAMENIGQLNELSYMLIGLDDRELAKYKSLLEATKCDSMDTAIQLAENLSQYSLHPELSSPADYAALCLKNSTAFPDKSLYRFIDMHRYGLKRMLEDNVEQTAYGMVRRRDGSHIISLVEQTETVMNDISNGQNFG